MGSPSTGFPFWPNPGVWKIVFPKGLASDMVVDDVQTRFVQADGAVSRFLCTNVPVSSRIWAICRSFVHQMRPRRMFLCTNGVCAGHCHRESMRTIRADMCPLRQCTRKAAQRGMILTAAPANGRTPGFPGRSVQRISVVPATPYTLLRCTGRGRRGR